MIVNPFSYLIEKLKSKADKSEIPNISFNGTLNGDILTIAKGLANNSISIYAVSNNPTNCPTDCKWGSYMFYKANNTCAILYTDKSHFASTYEIRSDSASITWHIV